MALMKFREPNWVKRLGVRPAHDGTQIVEIGSIENGGLTFYEVTADKTLYLCTATFGYSGVADGYGSFTIRTDAAATWFYLFTEANLALARGAARHVTFWPPMEIPAEYDFRINSQVVGLVIYGGIFGWEE